MRTVLCLLESQLFSRVSPGEVLLCLRVHRVPMPMMVLVRARNQLKHCFDELRPLAAWFSLTSMGIERWYTDVLFPGNMLRSAIAKASPADLESLVHASMERRRQPAALVLQRSTRMHLSRKRAGALRSARSRDEAATLIQSCSRGHAARRTIQRLRARLAAQIIACAWRVHAARRFARWAWLDREADRARARVKVYAVMTLQGVVRRKLALMDSEQCQAEVQVRAGGRSSILQVQEEIAEKMASISILQDGIALQDVADGVNSAGLGRVLGIKPLPPSRRGSKRRRGKSYVSRTAMGPLMRAMLEGNEEERLGGKIRGIWREDAGAGVDDRGPEVRNGDGKDRIDDVANAESDGHEVDGDGDVKEKECVAAEAVQTSASSTCSSEGRPFTDCSPTATPKKDGCASPGQEHVSPQTPLGTSPPTPVSSLDLLSSRLPETRHALLYPFPPSFRFAPSC